jgi:hypothetical protein
MEVRLKFMTMKLVVAMALLLALSGCSNDDDNNPTNPPGSSALVFVGTVNGDNGSLSGSLTFTVNDSAVTGTFRITTPTPATHALLGAFDSSSNVLGATGGGYNFAGAYDGSNRLEGLMSGNATGTFVTIRDDNNSSVAFCGTFTGDDDGVWNFTIDGTIIAGSYTTNSGDFGALDGTISGNAITIANPGGGAPLATGTRNGDNASGTWDNGVGDSGTWTGSRCN